MVYMWRDHVWYISEEHQWEPTKEVLFVNRKQLLLSICLTLLTFVIVIASIDWVIFVYIQLLHKAASKSLYWCCVVRTFQQWLQIDKSDTCINVGNRMRENWNPASLRWSTANLRLEIDDR